MPPWAQTLASKKTKAYQLSGLDSHAGNLPVLIAFIDFHFDKQRQLYTCRICPIRNSSDGFSLNHLSAHVQTLRHKSARSKHDASARLKAQSASAQSADVRTGIPFAPELSANSSLGPEMEEDIVPHEPCQHHFGPRTTELSPQETVIDLPDSQENSSEPFSRLGWTDSAGRRVFFSSGTSDSDPLAESLARALRRATGESLPADDELPDLVDDEDPLFCEDDLEDEITAEELNSNLFGPDSKSDWFPYPDKAMFLTDVLFSSPRLRFSRAQQKAVLAWGRDLGAPVPTYITFRKTQGALLAEVGDPTVRQESGRGTVFYMNEIGDSIKKDMANPFTREGMTFYPEDGGDKLGEVWHGDKMLRDIPDHLLSPTVKHNGVIYYVDELVKRSENRWFLPKRWLTRDSGSVMLASGYHVTDSADGLIVNAATLDIVEVSSFEANFVEILNANSGIYPFSFQSKAFADAMPHPLRTVAGSRPVYSIPLAIFIDDVSGNQSKQWNKHFSCYMSNGALPRTKLENEFHVRFVATSPFATPLEIMQGVRSSIETSFKDPIVAWDCEAKEEVLLRPYGLLFAGDNPMQAELCSCSGLNSNFFCRTCHTGGTREWKQSNDGFAETLKPGPFRNPVDTAEETFQQILTALEPNISTTLAEAVRLSGIKDTLAQPIIDSLVKMGQDLRKANPDGSSYSPDEVQTILTEELKKHQQRGEGITNPLFDMDGIDMHKDTPTEILHTILLGVVKYYWGQTIWLLEKGKDFPLFQTRLNSILEDGLNVPKIQADYMCQYKGGLIGKHFKTLSQVMAFAVHGLVPPDVLEAWLILGRLTVLLWHTEIEDISSYSTELEACINDFINITCKCSPSILISKPKFHFLLHLPFLYDALDQLSFSPPNVMKHTTPSSEPWSFAGIDRVKHIVTGGWWRDTKSGKWTCAKSSILRHILDHPEFAAMVGLPTKEIREPGSIIYHPVSRKHQQKSSEPTITWSNSLAGITSSSRFPLAPGVEHKTALSVVTCSGDKVLVGQNVIVRQEGGKFSPLTFATVREILVPVPFMATGVRVTVQLFQVEPSLHSELHMPVLTRSEQHTVLCTEDLESAVNLQHDCHHANCEPDGVVSVVQERENTTKTKSIMRHTDDHRFIVNTSSLHNYRQISAAIPANLRSHSFTVENPEALHIAAAVQIREKNSSPEEALDLLGVASTGESAEVETPAVLNDPAFSRVTAARTRKVPQATPVTLEACTNSVLSYLCKQNNELVSGNKLDLLTRLRPPRHNLSVADIKMAFDAVQSNSATKEKRKRISDETADGRPKKRRGAVEDTSRVANAELLRPLFFNRRGRQ
ncbi:hypothetical protein C8J57DRAFT_1719333 [Mycena rebaudengoi]|nr:hypothetical protein C8J57DRAFT_1719333 [Mycena rebaudengoi]